MTSQEGSPDPSLELDISSLRPNDDRIREISVRINHVALFEIPKWYNAIKHFCMAR